MSVYRELLQCDNAHSRVIDCLSQVFVVYDLLVPTLVLHNTSMYSV